MGGVLLSVAVDTSKELDWKGVKMENEILMVENAREVQCAAKRNCKSILKPGDNLFFSDDTNTLESLYVCI